MKKKDRLDKKRISISAKKYRHWFLHEYPKELIGWHLYKRKSQPSKIEN